MVIMTNLGVTEEGCRVGQSPILVVEVIEVTVLAVPVSVETVLKVLVATVTLVTVTV